MLKAYEETYISNIATALRDKNGSTTQYTVSEMENAVRELDKVYYTNGCVGYTKNMVLDVEGTPLQWNLYSGAWLMESISMPNCAVTTAGGNTFNGCSRLTSAYLPKFQNLGSNIFNGCTLLKQCQLGSVGFSVTNMTATTFNQCKQAGLEITIYVNADTLSGIVTAVSGTAPWGATNATIIYRNSTTGDVITE